MERKRGSSEPLIIQNFDLDQERQEAKIGKNFFGQERIDITSTMAEKEDKEIVQTAEKADPTIKSLKKYRRGNNVDFKVCRR